MKFYALFANDQLYDDSEQREIVEAWFDKFGEALKNNKVPHRWFHKFLKDDKLIPIKLELREFESSEGKRVKHLNVKI